MQGDVLAYSFPYLHGLGFSTPHFEKYSTFTPFSVVADAKKINLVLVEPQVSAVFRSLL